MPDYSNHMPGFTKLFSGLVHSTVWREEMHVKVVWITMLALADRKGHVLASMPGLADASRVSLEQCEDALKRLASPDKHSRTKEHEGRRIKDVDGGWALLNYTKYREMRDDENRRQQIREAQARFRERHPEVIKVSRGKPPSSQAEAEAEAEAENGRTEPPATSPADPRPEHERIRGSNFREASDLEVKILRVVKKISDQTGKPAWEVCRQVTSYKRKDGAMTAGVEDPARLGSILARQKALEDAEWWLAKLDKERADGATG